MMLPDRPELAGTQTSAEANLSATALRSFLPTDYAEAKGPIMTGPFERISGAYFPCTTSFFSMPTPSTSTSKTSPGARKRGVPMVPVQTISPGSKVK